MAIKTIRLTFDITGFWQVGTGQGSGAYLDALADKDRHGLPYIPGKMIKGLFRDAVNRLMLWKHFDHYENPVELLFGSSAFHTSENNDSIPRHHTQPGCLRFSNAVLNDQQIQVLSENDAYREALFQAFYSTAIGPEGIAKKGSLRGIELVVPLKLSSEVNWIGFDPEVSELEMQWVGMLEKAMPLIRQIGNQRNRGLGRVNIKWEDV